MSTERTASVAHWQELPESCFASPSPEETRILREQILRYAMEDLHIDPERAELYADAFSARYE